MGRRRLIQLLLVLGLVAVRFGKGSDPQSNAPAPFQWLESSGDTAGLIFSTHQMRPLSIKPDTNPSIEVEQEEKRLDSQTTRKIRRLFSTSVNGERRLDETIVEDIRKMSDGAFHAERIISRQDTNGRSQDVQKEIQDVAPSGSDSYRITKTVLLAGTNKTLVEKERIQQTEKRSGDKSVEIDRTFYTTGLTGTWRAMERRVSHNNLNSEQTRTEEQVYQNDVNDRLSLTQRLNIREWKDAAGQKHWISESYTPDMEGKFQLSSRLSMVQTSLQNGRQETTEIIEKPGRTAPKEGLKPVQKITEKLDVRSPSETERHLELFEPDLNGGMQRVKS